MKIIIFTVLLLSTLFIGSCTDLTETVYSDLSVDQFFTSEQNLLLNAGRAYTLLQPYPEEQKLWALVTVSSDECVICTLADGSWYDGGRDDEMKKHNVTTSNKINRLAWEYVFGGIAGCNEVLYETESSKFNFAGKDKIVGEIKVLRALFYYWGMDTWGDIPFSTDFTSKTLPVKKSRAFIYNFVEKEIKDNLSLLDSTVAGTNYGRVTKGLAYTLLAKLYLNANVWINTPRWAEAEQMCDKVIALGQYKLEDNYFNNFAIKNETSKENIFVIVNNSLLTHSFYWYDLTLSPLSKKTFATKETPWDGYICPPDFFNSYSNNDLRKKSWLYGQQYDINGNKLFEIAKKDTNWFVYNPIFPESAYKGRNKWDGARMIKYPFQTDGLIMGTLDMDNDFVLFRYADVVMMKVESMMQQGKTTEATQLADFQKIRTRAGMPPYTADQLTMDELLAERGREFVWEGHRRQDLIRFGKWNNAWYAKPVTTTDQVFPIPQTVLDTNPGLAGPPQ